MKPCVFAVLSLLVFVHCRAGGGCDTRTQNMVCTDFEGTPETVAAYQSNCTSSNGTSTGTLPVTPWNGCPTAFQNPASV